jgi:UDP-2,3-diacylglucosamine pyrophosphatase LpxH
MLIRVFSDTHWEFAAKAGGNFWTPKELDTDKETTLILAGDLWNGLDSINVIKTFNQRFKRVLIVLGNHDYWGSNYFHELDLDYQQELIIQGMDNCFLMDRDTFEFDGVLFIGATLWTNMGKEDPLTVHAATQIMYQDFNQIYTCLDSEYYFKKKFKPEDWLTQNRKDFNYIKAIVNGNKDIPIVIITHHGWTTQSIHEKYKDDKIANWYFISDYSEFILDNPHIKLIAHGHIHNKMIYNVGETKVVANPYGYPAENKLFDEVSLYEVN